MLGFDKLRYKLDINERRIVCLIIIIIKTCCFTKSIKTIRCYINQIKKYNVI